MKFILVLVAACCTACVAFDHGDANKFQRGMTPETVLDLASKEPKRSVVFTIASDPNASFRALVFDLALGSTSAEYFVVFEADRLLYWGHPYEFNRHPDARINEICKAAVDASR